MQTTGESPNYSDHYLGDKGKEYFAWQSGPGLFGGRIISHTFRHLIKPSDSVLDFGCGGGFLLKNLECARRIGIEINPIARDYATEMGIDCYGDTQSVPNGIADVIISNHALEHVPYPIGALRELHSKLKPNGLLAVCVPIDNWRRQRRYNPNDQNHHLHTWTPLSFGNTLAEAGYEVLSIYARISAWPGNWTVATYGRLPFWVFRSICFIYGWLTGQGTEIIALARPRGSPDHFVVSD
jgi:SAM-dependent methyltransferase